MFLLAISCKRVANDVAARRADVRETLYVIRHREEPSEVGPS